MNDKELFNLLYGITDEEIYELLNFEGYHDCPCDNLAFSKYEFILSCCVCGYEFNVDTLEYGIGIFSIYPDIDCFEGIVEWFEWKRTGITTNEMNKDL